ncbi:OmpA family protein [Lentisalinibacter sediminis]|uniref:OmpA family protein n=1 Tax=Lentisalinibacter sediminis TaxID=2992237 RepID=UPI00386632D7
MNKLNIYVIASAVGLALSAPAMAAELSAADYAAAENDIEADYASAREACDSLSGNAAKLCLVEAEGMNEIAKADLAAKNEPGAETRFDAQIARAEAAYAAAKERCNDTSRTASSDCLASAKTAESAAKAKADAERKMATATSRVNPNTTADPRDNDTRATDTLFDFDSAELRAASRTTLDEFVGKSKENSLAQISVTGYTDRLGTDAYNQKLSEQRTDAVKGYLVSEGIAASRISAESKGQSQPATRANECQGERSAAIIACLQPDRRVVVSMSEVVSSN